MPPKGKRKRGQGPSGPKKKKAAKVLSTAKKAAVKAKVKPPIKARAQRLKTQGSVQAFGDLYREEVPICTPFDSKRRGCKTASVTLYPQTGVDSNKDSDAIGTLPSSIGAVKAKYPGYNWKSGHVINADFGGDGELSANMTCLTSSANGQQNAFDGPVKRARVVLHKAYSLMRKCGAQKEFFDDQLFGIKVSAVVSDDTWGDTYPDNCIANELRLTATVVNAPSEPKLREVMKVASSGGNVETDIAQVLKLIADVSAEVDKANLNAVVTNDQ
jgi:hypothetical protein